MRRSITHVLRLAIAGGISIISLNLQAAPLPVGSLVVTPAGSLGVGAINITSSGAGFATPAGPGQFSGNFLFQTWKNDSNNPYGLNALTFVYQATNDNPGVSFAPIERITTIDFTGVATDVAYDDAGGTQLAPTTTSRATGSTVGWNYPLGLAPGGITASMIVRTNATLSLPATAFLIDGQVTSTNSVGPDVSSIIPEPASVGMLICAGGLLMTRRKASIA